jgi:hypothetical protein
MALLSKSVYGSVRIPRIYVDYIQYAKAIGHIQQYTTHHISGEKPNVWDFNPVKFSKYTVHDDHNDLGSNVHWRVRFPNYPSQDMGINRQFSRFLSTMNYYGILGHNLAFDANGGIERTAVVLGLENSEAVILDSDDLVGIVGNPDNCANELGYSLYEITSGIPQEDGYDEVHIYIYKDENNAGYTVGDTIDIGTFTMGRFFDFPHSANLSMNLNYNADGIKSRRTVGGSDLTDITYTKPNWGNHAAWTHIDTDNYDDPENALAYEDYKQVSYQGRRSWDLTFSFLSKTDTFTKSMERNMSGIYNPVKEGWLDVSDLTGVGKNNIIGNFLTFTLNGQIPFIFQPDNTKQDFVIAKLQSNSLSIQQSAPDLYTAKMNFVEVW